jgi:hypothetical protein
MSAPFQFLIQVVYPGLFMRTRDETARLC